MSYWVYIMSNPNNKVIYIGITDNLTRRIYEHKNKLIEGFTKKYNITKLLYYEEFGQVNDAIAAEKRLKGWTRKKKNSLIMSMNPYWNDLNT
ncbi:GIY-YIG nuclease family protein [Candidatus Daviesbacteria bacterium]|nr:GIY-YIG nuclease family protein [Candidatus Daviesbacteria bacterium]